MAAPAPESSNMNNFHLFSRAQTVTKILSHHFIFIFSYFGKNITIETVWSQETVVAGLLTSPGFIGVPKTEFQ